MRAPTKGHDVLSLRQHPGNYELRDGHAIGARLFANGSSQWMSLGTTPLVAANILPQAIGEFRSRRPDLRIRLFDADLNTIMRRVEAGKLVMGLGIFKPVPGVRRLPFLLFSNCDSRRQDGVLRRASTTLSAINGQTLISLPPSYPHQQLIDDHLAKNRVAWQRGLVVNFLDTQIALVEADEGIAIIRSFGLSACRNRKVVMSQLINPVVNLEFHQISNRGKKLPPGADEFTAFLKTYIATWAGRAGVL